MNDDEPKTNAEELAALFQRAADLSREPLVFVGDDTTETDTEN